MEISWKKAFGIAQKYMQNERTVEKAKEVLSPYRGVSEKTTLMHDLFTNAHVHKRFRDAISKKDFFQCSELVKRHKFLKECVEYDALVKYASTIYEKAKQLLESNDTNSAMKFLKTLLDFEDFKVEAKSNISDIECAQQFFNAVNNDETLIAYKLLDAHEILLKSPDGIKLQKLWDEDITIADSYASQGNTLGIKDTLKKYLKIDSKKMVIATLVSWAYITQLEKAIKLNTASDILENAIKNYILYFGLNGSILMFFEIFKIKYTDTKLNLESLAQGSENAWRPSMIVKSILD